MVRVVEFGYWNRFIELLKSPKPQTIHFLPTRICSKLPDWYCIFAGGTFPRFHRFHAASALMDFARRLDAFYYRSKTLMCGALQWAVTVHDSTFLCVTLPTF